MPRGGLRKSSHWHDDRPQKAGDTNLHSCNHGLSCVFLVLSWNLSLCSVPAFQRWHCALKHSFLQFRLASVEHCSDRVRVLLRHECKFPAVFVCLVLTWLSTWSWCGLQLTLSLARFYDFTHILPANRSTIGHPSCFWAAGLGRPAMVMPLQAE